MFVLIHIDATNDVTDVDVKLFDTREKAEVAMKKDVEEMADYLNGESYDVDDKPIILRDLKYAPQGNGVDALQIQAFNPNDEDEQTHQWYILEKSISP
jgi:hypothetical protein